MIPYQSEREHHRLHFSQETENVKSQVYSPVHLRATNNLCGLNRGHKLINMQPSGLKSMLPALFNDNESHETFKPLHGSYSALSSHYSPQFLMGYDLQSRNSKTSRSNKYHYYSSPRFMDSGTPTSSKLITAEHSNAYPSSKRKRSIEMVTSQNDTETTRKSPTKKRHSGSADYIRKGQWTTTEELLARVLIEAFEDGYLPIYTGVRLRGYLAVQLQCDPMRVSKKLCAGSIDGKKIPKNYGQKKFKIRSKASWDQDKASMYYSTLRRLTTELWWEMGMNPPPFLNLCSTRNGIDHADHEEKRRIILQQQPARHILPTDVHDANGDHTYIADAQFQESHEPERATKHALEQNVLPDNTSSNMQPDVISPVTKHTKNDIAFPIIYLNLSRKKQLQMAEEMDDEHALELEEKKLFNSESNYNESQDEDTYDYTARRDYASLQAAYDLLVLHRQNTHAHAQAQQQYERIDTQSQPFFTTSSGSFI